MKSIKEINRILDDITFAPSFQKFMLHAKEIKKYIDANKLFDQTNRKLFMKNNFVLYSKISLFYYKWSRFVLSWLLHEDNPCLVRFVLYHRYISESGHKRSSSKYLNISIKLYTMMVIHAFETLSEHYDSQNNDTGRKWTFYYQNFIKLSPELGVPTIITLYDMYDQWYFENALMNCVQHKLLEKVTI